MKKLFVASFCCRAGRALLSVAGFALFIGGIVSTAHAMQPVPEVDPASATSALTLLSGGLLILASRIRGK